MSRGQGNALAAAGGLVLLAAFALSLYSTPGPSPAIPDFPLLTLRFPLVPLLLVVGVVLVAAGIVFPRGTLAFLVLGAVSVIVIVAGIGLWILGAAYAVPVGGSIYVMPYSTHAILVAAVGLLLGFFDVLFSPLTRLMDKGQGNAPTHSP